MHLINSITDTYSRLTGRWLEEVAPPRRLHQGDALLRMRAFEQTNSFSCGAVAAYTVIAALSKQEPNPEEVYAAVRPDRAQGTSLRRLARVLDNYGVGCRTSPSLSWARLTQNIDKGFPVVVSLNLQDDLTHWAVLCGYGRRKTFAGVVYLSCTGGELDDCLSWEDLQGMLTETSKGVVFCRSPYPCRVETRHAGKPARAWKK